MRLVSIIPKGTKIDFLRLRHFTIIGSGALCVLSLVLYFLVGLNYGVDFRGGIMIEIRTPQAADISALRTKLGGLNLGEVELQEFGQPTDVLIRIARQVGDEKEQLKAVETVRKSLGDGVDYRRVEFVGPKVGAELVRAGIISIVLSLVSIMIYIWFRFEWQFGVAGVTALAHDVVMTVGLFAVTGLEFNLTSLAAVLTIAGFSINDTVVIFDRVRENLRKYKAMDLVQLINVSVNETLSRTILTSLTVFIAVLSLFLFGGPVIEGFSLAMLFGVFVGCYSTVYIASPLVIYFGLDRARLAKRGSPDDGKAAAERTG